RGRRDHGALGVGEEHASWTPRGAGRSDRGFGDVAGTPTAGDPRRGRGTAPGDHVRGRLPELRVAPIALRARERRPAAPDGGGVVIATDDPRVLSWTDRVVALRDGVIEAEGSPSDVARVLTTD